MDARLQARRALEARPARRARARASSSSTTSRWSISQRNERSRRRGAAALASPASAADPAGGVHPARRGDRADRAARRMGAAQACTEAARWPEPRQGGGQPVAGAVQQPQPRHDGRRGARRVRPAARSGWSSRSPKRCCCRTTRRRWRSCISCGRSACGSPWTTSAPAIRRLSYLRSFPFDKIKIDRSFIKDIDRNRDSAGSSGPSRASAKASGSRPQPKGSRPRNSSRSCVAPAVPRCRVIW